MFQQMIPVFPLCFSCSLNPCVCMCNCMCSKWFAVMLSQENSFIRLNPFSHRLRNIVTSSLEVYKSGTGASGDRVWAAFIYCKWFFFSDLNKNLKEYCWRPNQRGPQCVYMCCTRRNNINSFSEGEKSFLLMLISFIKLFFYYCWNVQSYCQD